MAEKDAVVPVTEQTCGRCRTDIDRQLGTSERRLNVHSDEISEITVAVVKLTQLQEIQSKQLDLLMQERRHSAETALSERDTGMKFWQSKPFFIMTAGGVALVLMLGMAAIGQNYLKDINNTLAQVQQVEQGLQSMTKSTK